MKSLLKKIAVKLGLLRSPSSQKQAFFTYQINKGTITCRWCLDKGTKRRLKHDDPTGSLHLRLRQLDDLQGRVHLNRFDEGSESQEKLRIDSLPETSGRLLLELGYKQLDGTFVTLYFQHIELEKVEARSANDDWFPMSPPKSIHEVMRAGHLKHEHRRIRAHLQLKNRKENAGDLPDSLRLMDSPYAQMLAGCILKQSCSTS